jgi:prevent-host-death family protein
MPKTINATEAVRAFSEILNSVKYHHESYTITRGGKPAAALVPIDSAPGQKTLGELPELLKSMPKLGDDVDCFMNDIEEAVRQQPAPPEKSIWE